MARLLLSFCLVLSWRLAQGEPVQCSEPGGRLGTTFDCAMKLGPAKDAVRKYLAERTKGAEVAEEGNRLTATTKEETVVVWLEQQAVEKPVKFRVEVRPGGQMPLLGESSDAARALREFVARGVH